MKELYAHLPDTPGIYIMRGERGEVLYIGKAVNLKRRVSSYFLRAHDARIERLVREIRHIDFETTDTAIEALILEAKRIREHMPPYNIREKDNKSFLYVEITKEKFPRVLLVRGTEAEGGRRFGPFTSSMEIRKALTIIRKILPFSTHPPEKVGTYKRPCFEAELGICPGTCVNAVTEKEYKTMVRHIVLLFEGKKARLVSALEKEMKKAAREERYEEAARAKRQITALEHIRDLSLVRDPFADEGADAGSRIEGYDISMISGDAAVGSMVVFQGNEPEKSGYRKFRIRSIAGANDVGMLEEVVRRRFGNDWPLPDLVLVDGGLGQVHAAERVLRELGYSIPVVGMAKGPERKRHDIVGRIPKGVTVPVLIRVRDEAHRFAITYHRAVRGKRFTPGHARKKTRE